jgi:hypothetical protein
MKKVKKMNKQERVALAIKGVISKMMDRVMDNVLVNDPFLKEKHHSSKRHLPYF